MKYFCPVVIKTASFKKISLSKSVVLRSLTKREAREFFGIDDISYSFARLSSWVVLSNIKSAKINGRWPHSKIVQKGIFDGTHDVLASKFIAQVECQGRQDLFDLFGKINLSFKLLAPTSTGISVYFREQETDVGFFDQTLTLNGPFDYLTINKNQLLQLKFIFSLVSDLEDKKFNLVSLLYRRAILGDKSQLDVRFLLLTAALESLYLPSQNQELGYRLRLRISNLLGQFTNKDPKELNDTVKKVYDVRSKIIHTGMSDRLQKNNNIFAELVNLVRVSIIMYAYDRALFKDEYLNKLCLIDRNKKVTSPKSFALLINSF